jgi:hypothetical protein
LLLNYGFCLNNNKYNSLSFRVWVNFNWQEEKRKEEERKEAEAKGKQVSKKNSSDSEEESPEKDNQISKVIRLKRNRFNEEIFAYLRANLLNTYKGKNLPYLLVSAPVDAEFEMLVVACTINLLKGLMTSRFKTPLETDRGLLQDKSLSIRQRFAILHRMNAKEILEENINYCQILMRILARFGTDQDYKARYMQLVEGFESEEQIIRNRVRLRRYLRELMINQKRVLQAALDKDYIEKVKEYFESKKKEDELKAQKMKEKEEAAAAEEDEEEYDEEEEEEEENEK